MSKIEELADRVERLLLRHAELRRTNALLEQQLAAVTQERPTLHCAAVSGSVCGQSSPDEKSSLSGRSAISRRWSRLVGRPEPGARADAGGGPTSAGVRSA